MPVLNWDKPARKTSVAEWKSISADGAPPGVYTPNMSDADKLKWKATKRGGADPRVEIRKTAKGVLHGKHTYGQVLIVVRPDSMAVSIAGKALFDNFEASELAQAIREAQEALL